MYVKELVAVVTPAYYDAGEYIRKRRIDRLIA